MKTALVLLCSLGLHFQACAQKIAWNPYELNSNFYQFKLSAELGTLKVEENRSNSAQDNKVELAILRLKSTNPSPDFPIVFLAGGPGNSGIETARGEMLPIFLKLREVADVIVLDQRGTGQSKPNLSFAEGKFTLPLDQSLDSPESMQILQTSAEAWATTLLKKGIDLSAYNTAESAADLEALRKALGAEKINLWGFSYGTHLALAYLKKYDQHVQRVILGGINALDDRFRLPADGDQTIRKMAELVQQTPKLNQAIPDLYALTQAVFASLAKQPVTVNKLPFSQQKVNIKVGKFDLQVALSIVSAQSWFPRIFPSFIHDMSQQKTEFAGFYIRENVKNPRANLSTAMAFTAHCASGVAADRKEKIIHQSQNALLGNGINFPFMAMEFCAIWGIKDLGDESEPQWFHLFPLYS
jgi:pimeloyl-ACP methyl ester carboxylesterase